MEIIKLDSFNKIVGYKIGLLTYGKITNSREAKTYYRVEVNFGKANRFIPNCLWMMYNSPAKPKFRNLPFLHVFAIPQIIASSVYLVLVVIFNVTRVTCFYHIHDTLRIYPRDKTRLVYEFIWTGLALFLIVLQVIK